MSTQRPGTPPRPEGPPRPWGAPATAPGFSAATVPEVPGGVPPAAVPAARQEGPPAAGPWSAVPWAADPGAGGGAGTAPATGRMRRIAQDLPDWEPLPPGELLVRRRGAGT